MEYLVGLLMLSMLAITSIQIVSRFILQNPTIWTEELSKFLMAWMVFLGIPLGLKKGIHLKIDLNIQNVFSPFFKFLTEVALNLASLVLWVIIAKYGYEFALSLRYIPALTFSLNKIWVFLCVPISGIFTIVFTIEKMFVQISNYRKTL